MKKKRRINLSVRLPQRLYKVIEDIAPLFIDWDAEEPTRGALTRALEYILQYYMLSEDYQEKINLRARQAEKIREILIEKDIEKQSIEAES